MKQFNLISILIIFLFYGCNPKNNKGTISKKESNKECIDSDNERQIVHDNEGILYTIKYANDTICVQKENDIITKIDYRVGIDKIFPINGLIVSNESKNCYITKNQVLLLPLLEVNNQLNMIVVDLKKAKELQYRNKENQIDLITTGINCFYFNEEKMTIIGSNTLNYDGKTTLHYYKINNENITNIGNRDLKLTVEILENNKAFFNLINTGNNKYPSN